MLFVASSYLGRVDASDSKREYLCSIDGVGAWLMAPEVSLCVVNDQPIGNPKRKV
jgi:hypothetical protein